MFAGQLRGILVSVKIQIAFSIGLFDGFVTNNRKKFMLCPELIYSIAVQKVYLVTADLHLEQNEDIQKQLSMNKMLLC